MINKAIIIGNLGADPETRHTSSGTAVTNFNVATTDRWKDQSGEQQESTEWHRIVAWQRLGEICGEYLRKGSRVYIEGRLQTRKWTDRDGNDRYTTEIVAKEMKMLDRKGDNNTGATDYEQKFSSAPTTEPAPRQRSMMGDDVPF